MAKYSIAELMTGKNEGGYANNKADNGGETFAGIARKFWPNWKGWATIDRIKRDFGTLPSTINKHAFADQAIQLLITQFYKQNFWDINLLDLIQDQQLANTIYDFSVNAGEEKAASYMQQAVNEMTDCYKLTVDGDFGRKTIEAINALNPALLHSAYNKKRRDFYVSIAKGNQKQFLSSWLSRLKEYK